MRDIGELVVLALVIYLVITFVVQTVHVEGQSMVPTLHNNDLLVADKITLDFQGPSRGEIVVIQPPISSPTDFIKRVIGLPGEWIRIAPDAKGIGHVYVDRHHPVGAGGGEELREPYVNGLWRDEVQCCTSRGQASPTLPPSGHWVRIPARDYFVMGDNRNVSEDSRTFGWEPRSGIVAVARFRFWPLNRIATLPGPVPTPVPSAALGALGALPMVRRRRRGRHSMGRPPAP
ncbi:MAG TPA: signal peptidase I [Candidatus Micrarchaeia archaeon]|nr:signal peptidase I [Candidatus Micrarchaeia archaeon]